MISFCLIAAFEVSFTMVVRYPSNGAKVDRWFGNFEKSEIFKIFIK